MDYGGTDVFVCQPFLDGASVATGLQQLGGEDVPKGVAACVLLHGLFFGALYATRVHVVALGFFRDPAARSRRVSWPRAGVRQLEPHWGP